jgi:hypothetical protein
MIGTNRSMNFRGDEMSVSSISSISLIPSSNQNTQTNLRRFQQEFQQLGSDLQTGTLSTARQDHTQLQTNFQKAEHTRKHHHHPVRDPLETSQWNDQSGQVPQSGNVSSSSSSVPAAYNSVLQDFQHFGQGTAASLTPDLSALSSNSISVSA